MKKKKKTVKKKKPLYFKYKYSLILLIVAVILFGWSFHLNQKLNEPERTLQENFIVFENKTYKQFLDNYYEVDYGSSNEGFVLKIKNKCIQASTSTGESMKPYIGTEAIVIYDTCYPKEDLKVGDIIIYLKEWTTSNYVRHRIVEIDHEQKWVRTQGDNPDTNPAPDDLIDFNRIAGKDIGHLDVLADKKVVQEEVVEDIVNESLFVAGDLSFKISCVCSSSGYFRFCINGNTDRLYNDTFIKENDFKEEYCK